MKKGIFIFLLIFVLFGYFTNFNKKIQTTEAVLKENSTILEEITPIRDDTGFLGIEVLLEIPENYSDKEILINPDIFEGISQYEKIIPNKSYIINLSIKNNSNYDYQYRKNSFIISTKKLEDTNNYYMTGGVGFDSLKIFDLYQPYRTYNEAIISLFDGEKEALTDADIDEKLKDKGYSGLDDLARYYLDFYRNNSLYLLANKIFSGDVSKYLESNTNIIELSYNYLYNSLINFSFKDKESYSIGEFMINKDFDNIADNILGLIKAKNNLNINMNINISELYREELYKYYNFFGDYKFYLDKVDN